jgi:nicotinate dehydrogenase subunit B
VKRRDFLELTGATGLLLTFPLSGQEPERLPARQAYPTDFNAYLKIGPDGRTTCFVGKVELGQGSMTALAMLLAEELDVAFDSVDMVMGDTDLCPWDMGTFGSLNIWQFGPVLRGAAAEARAVLLEMAAERLETPRARLQVADGVVTGEGGRRVTYAQLVEGKRIARHLRDVKVKEVSAFKVVGKPTRRKDALDKVTGRARYAGDLGPAGVLHACVLRPPAHGARLKTLDTTAAEQVPGARILLDGDLVAALHARPDVAREALERMKATWDLPDATVSDQTIFDHLLKTAPAPRVVAQKGDLAEGERAATIRIEETYLNAYVAHAPVETHSAVAQLKDGRMTVWASTQAPFSVKPQVAQALGLPAKDVRIITPYVGGGFGGKSGGPQAVEAARLARLAGAPVQVVWDRREEFFLDTFRPAAVVKVRAGADGDGKLTFWDFQVTGAGDREAKSFYDAGHHRTTSAGGWQGGNPPGMQPLAVGPWRAPSVNTITFARESHMDRLAARAGLDPVTFRLRNLADPRMVRVLRTAAERFGWTPKVSPSRRGFGVACAMYNGTYVAALAEVAVDGTGHVQVKRISFSQDMGVVVSPDGARQQIEGCLTMGLGYALTEEVRFRGGDILERNFDSYQLPRFSWLPQLDIHLVDNPVDRATGCGEPPIVVMGALLANAIFDATGVRLNSLPMSPERLKAALAKA